MGRSSSSDFNSSGYSRHKHSKSHKSVKSHKSKKRRECSVSPFSDKSSDSDDYKKAQRKTKSCRSISPKANSHHSDTKTEYSSNGKYRNDDKYRKL